MNRLVQLILVGLACLTVDAVSAQVACGSPNVLVEAIPPVATLGEAIEIRITNNNPTGQIGVSPSCTYLSIHVGSDCNSQTAIRTNIACQGPIDSVPAGTSTSGFWHQIDDSGQQVPPGEYWVFVYYFTGQSVPDCCFPLTITSPLATYCTAKPSFIGCTATVSTSSPETQPVSGASDYSVKVTFVETQKTGLIFASHSGPAATPFLGGFLCVQQPLKRGVLQNSGGFVPCEGTLSAIVNDGVSFPVGFDPGPGNSAWFQAWHRIGGVGNVGLSNAVRLDFQ